MHGEQKSAECEIYDMCSWNMCSWPYYVAFLLDMLDVMLGWNSWKAESEIVSKSSAEILLPSH
jgi:hypothetical protein